MTIDRNPEMYFVLWRAGDGCAYREVHEFTTIKEASDFVKRTIKESRYDEKFDIIKGRRQKLLRNQRNTIQRT